MAFYLYAAGSGGKNVVDYKRKIGYHQLLSQYAERKALLEWVDYLREHPECKCKLFVDSGAYTAHTKGVDIDVDEYIKLINDITDQVTVFAQVDKIPGRWGQPKTVEQVMSAPKESWDNYLYILNIPCIKKMDMSVVNSILICLGIELTFYLDLIPNNKKYIQEFSNSSLNMAIISLDGKTKYTTSTFKTIPSFILKDIQNYKVKTTYQKKNIVYDVKTNKVSYVILKKD